MINCLLIGFNEIKILFWRPPSVIYIVIFFYVIKISHQFFFLVYLFIIRYTVIDGQVCINRDL